MALRNAFAEIATEFTLRKLVEQLRFARDPNDRLRVIVDASPQVTVLANNTTGAIGVTAVAPYTSASWNVMDARHEMQEASQQTFIMTRNRWSIT